MEHNPADLLPSPRQPERLPRALKAADVARLLDRIPPPRRSSCATVRSSSSPTPAGCARGRSSTSTSSSVDFDAEELRVEGKGGKTRMIPVGEAALRAVSATWSAAAMP